MSLPQRAELRSISPPWPILQELASAPVTQPVLPIQEDEEDGPGSWVVAPCVPASRSVYSAPFHCRASRIEIPKFDPSSLHNRNLNYTQVGFRKESQHTHPRPRLRLITLKPLGFAR